MPKFLKFVFDFLAIIMGLLIVSGVAIIFPLFSIPLLCNVLLRIPTILVEFIVLRRYLIGEQIKKALFQMNAYAILSLMPLWFSAFIFQELFGASIGRQMWIQVCFAIIISILIGLCEVYIQVDFIKKRNLATNLPEVKKRLRCIVVPFWILFFITFVLIAMLLPWVINTFFMSTNVDPNITYI